MAALRTDTDDARYFRQAQSTGAKDTFDFGTDSNLGLQLNAKANDRLSATLQIVSKRRSKVDDSTRVEWAEVYGIAGVDLFTGVDVSYAHDPGDGTLKFSALASRTDFALDLNVTIPGFISKVDMKRTRGANLSWENDWLNLRATRIEGHSVLPAIVGGQQIKYPFQGVSAIVNRNNLLLQAEYATRRATGVNNATDNDGWYVLGGYRLGQFQPFVGYSKQDPTRAASLVNDQRQSTKSLGVRWDFHRSLALKAQWDIGESNRVLSAVGRGDFTQRVEADLPGDLADLKRGVNDSAASVQRTMDALDAVMDAAVGGRFRRTHEPGRARRIAR
ncbi:hypothetical protein [Xanthomonas theicola]|uniref:HAMP domain-containing protein n=1 Tax=Xanthomonas theicola TaxID=56464 RepID=A0A2S6ZJF7_9XANT|nr:hypothetical protein [Xanthomonas theicola]PPT92412.1 hypothetical protein XthCFBP4691_04150 [Xanthomonas theicola]QNH25130.1 hypothetical protein G4Q83_10800 [Xanthomonas theicola]